MHENKESITEDVQYAICSVAASPVRKEPSHRSEMVNQLVFGEAMVVLEMREEWLRIQSLYDEYEGWITFHFANPIGKALATSADVYFTSDLLSRIEIKTGEAFYLPMGSFLRGFEKDTNRVWNDAIYKGGVSQGSGSYDIDSLIDTAKSWLHVPYLWGGKTAMGVDCSGFVQTVFKVHGIALKRDAYLQAEGGSAVNFTDACAGDVAFFSNESGHITHVGILLGNDHIIHAAGKVRIDDVDERGIQNKELGRQTHSLHSVRKIVS